MTAPEAPVGISVEYATELLNHGFSLVPLLPRSKEPDTSVLPDGEWKHFQQYRPTPEDLQAWFGNGVQRNALLIPRELFVIVDGDTPEALAWMHTNLPETPAKTITARGEHWFFA